MNVCVIPARGGSTRIPRKNVRMFFGKPIIAYSIETARKSNLFARIIVSTEDDQTAAVARTYGAEVIARPKHLADDRSGTQEVMADALQSIPCEYACCLYATAPLLEAEVLKFACKTLMAHPAMDYAFAVGTDPLHDAGQFYFGKGYAFLYGAKLFSYRSLMIPVPKESDCDINVERDWVRAELLYAALHKVAIA